MCVGKCTEHTKTHRSNHECFQTVLRDRAFLNSGKCVWELLKLIVECKIRVNSPMVLGFSYWKKQYWRQVTIWLSTCGLLPLRESLQHRNTNQRATHSLPHINRKKISYAFTFSTVKIARPRVDTNWRHLKWEWCLFSCSNTVTHAFCGIWRYRIHFQSPTPCIEACASELQQCHFHLGDSYKSSDRYYINDSKRSYQTS